MDGKSSNVNYWSDGIFESSGASTPGGPQQRSAALRPRFPEDSPARNFTTEVPISNLNPVGDHQNNRAESLRMARKSQRSRSSSRGSGRGAGAGSSRKKASRARGGFDAGDGAGSDNSRRYPSTGTTIEGTGGGGPGSARFDGTKMEAKGLRRRARAIRGALLRRGVTEKNRAAEAAGDAVAGGSAIGRKCGVGVQGMSKGGAGRKQNLHLRLPSDRIPQFAAATRCDNDGHTLTQKSSVSEQKQGKVSAARRPVAVSTAAGRPTALTSGVTPWDSNRQAGERLTSSSSPSEGDDSEPESTAHRRNGSSNGTHFFTPIVPFR